MKTLNFYTKGNYFYDKDVSITVLKGGERSTNRTTFTFRHDVANRFGSEYIKIAFDENRIYFAPATKREGWKLSQIQNNKANKTIQIPPQMVELTKPFNSLELDIQYDSELELWFVERS